jgi:hypothetical protein
MKYDLPALTYSCEYVAFISMKLEDNAFAFFGVDAYLEKGFFLGGEKNSDDKMVLKKIRALIDHSDFNKEGREFTLVLDDFENLENEINQILLPVKGTILFDDELSKSIIAPMLKHLGEWLEDLDDKK